MKKFPYLRHLLILIVYILMWILNLFIAPLLFITGNASKVIKRTINGKVNFWSWFINTDEPTIKENLYGDVEYLRKRGILDIPYRGFFTRFRYFFLWNVIRNSYFYFKLNVIKPIPKKVFKKNIRNIVNTTSKGDMAWCTWGDRGKIHTEYTIDDVKYFRYSETKVVNIFLLGKFERKIQFGASGIEDRNRYIYKINFRKINTI